MTEIIDKYTTGGGKGNPDNTNKLKKELFKVL